MPIDGKSAVSIHALSEYSPDWAEGMAFRNLLQTPKGNRSRNMDTHHKKAKRSGMNETVIPYLKLTVAILAFMVVTAVPEKSISQIQNQTAAGAGNLGMEAEAPGDISLDNLKKIRVAVENAGDLAEELKKGVLSYLDRAIFFRETEAQLRKQAEDIKQRVKAAPERIKAIEAELEKCRPTNSNNT
jgi:hypothetical protein